MPEYNVVVSFDGIGRLKVRADSEADAREDAEQMDPNDIQWDSHDIEILFIEKVNGA